MGVYQTRWGLLAILFLGCDPGDRAMDAGLRGPPDGVLMFDPSMLTDANSVDASVSPRDTGGLVRVDARQPTTDAGRRQRCGGVARSCSGLTTNCYLIMGCVEDGDCRGVARSCYGYSESYGCGSQRGCYWSSSSRMCSGGPTSCGSIYNSLGCDRQDGCYWSDQCSGFPTSCSTLSNAACETQPGCLLEWY